MKVKLLHSTPLVLIANAIRMSRDNHHLSDSSFIQYHNGKSNFYDINYIGEKDLYLIKRVGFKMKHESVLEFGYFIFEIDGISRACLQELARHRLVNLTVKSTRYTLKELKNEQKCDVDNCDIEFFYECECVKRFSKYLVYTGNIVIDRLSIEQLNNLISTFYSVGSNDIMKYSLPEAFKTKLQCGINLRSLINFLELRTSKDALWEIRQLAIKILDELKEKQPLYFELLMENEKIKNNYKNNK